MLDAVRGAKPFPVCWRLIEDGEAILNVRLELLDKTLVAVVIIKQLGDQSLACGSIGEYPDRLQATAMS